MTRVYTFLKVMHDAWFRQGSFLSILRLRFRRPHDFSFSVRCLCGRGCRSGGMGALDFDVLPQVPDIPFVWQDLPSTIPLEVYTCTVHTKLVTIWKGSQCGGRIDAEVGESRPNKKATSSQCCLFVKLCCA